MLHGIREGVVALDRLGTLLGLLELGLHEQEAEYVAEVADTRRASAAQLADRLPGPLLSALLAGKSAISAERGVALRVSPATRLPERVVPGAAEAGGPLSAQEVAERAGLSRSTAQRYLKHLEQDGRLRLTLKYGDTGRPEHLYGTRQSGAFRGYGPGPPYGIGRRPRPCGRTTRARGRTRQAAPATAPAPVRTGPRAQPYGSGRARAGE